MKKSGPIVLIDDDLEDLEIYKSVLESLDISNEILLFSNPSEFLEFLQKDHLPIFLILCDVNMPLINGFELRRQLVADNFLAVATVPFLFFSTSSAADNISSAYRESIQGYFVKPYSLTEIDKMFRNIIAYWTDSQHPYTNN